MWIKREKYENLEKQVKHYKNLAGTHLVTINEKNAEIKELKEKIKRLEVSNLQKDTSNQHE